MSVSTNYLSLRAHRQNDARHWFDLELSLDLKSSEEPVYAYAATYHYNVVSLDEVASEYTFENWGAGLYSGVRYALNSRRDLQMLIRLFRGYLASTDMHDVAVIASNLVAKRLQNGRITSIDGWEVIECGSEG